MIPVRAVLCSQGQRKERKEGRRKRHVWKRWKGRKVRIPYEPVELFFHCREGGRGLHLSALDANRDGVGLGMHKSYAFSCGRAGPDEVLR